MNINKNFITRFETEVFHKYQDEMKLKNTVRIKTGGAEKVRFNVIDQGMAHKRVPKTEVVPMGINHGYVDIFLEDWSAPDYCDIYDLEKINFDDRKEKVTVIKKALGRRQDQMILDALATTTTAARTVGMNVGGNTAFNLQKVLRAKRYFDTIGVPENDRFIALDPGALEQLIQITEVASSDYNTVKALYEGAVKKYAGFEFIWIGARKEGGLPFSEAGGTVTGSAYAWQKDAMGLAVGIDNRVEMNYIPNRTSWLINGILQAGSGAVQPDGVVTIVSQWDALPV